MSFHCDLVWHFVYSSTCVKFTSPYILTVEHHSECISRSLVLSGGSLAGVAMTRWAAGVLASRSLKRCFHWNAVLDLLCPNINVKLSPSLVKIT